MKPYTIHDIVHHRLAVPIEDMDGEIYPETSRLCYERQTCAAYQNECNKYPPISSG